MSSVNAGCLPAAGVDCCVLGNNHILDWGNAGLLETLATLDYQGIKTSGAGQDLAHASGPAVLDVADNKRVIVFALASVSSGTPRNWAATQSSGGRNLLAALFYKSAGQLARARGQNT